MKIFRFGAVGRIRIKGESSAPAEWKRSIWDKLKNNDLFTPINIHDENNIREIKVFFNKKVFVIGINLFLLTFSYSFVKDFYVIIQSRNNILNINKIDFTKELPPKLLNYKNNKELNDQWVSAMSAHLKEKYWQNNMQNFKSAIWPLTNDLLILLMISKYYWKRKKT
jgi:hypothetical protein